MQVAELSLRPYRLPPPLSLISSVQSLSCVRFFAIPWTAACQASLSITNSWSLLRLMSTESVMPSNHLILCHPLVLPPSIFPSIRVFSNESALRIRWPKYWSFSFSIGPANEYSGLIPLGWTGWISLQSKGLSRVLLQHRSLTHTAHHPLHFTDWGTKAGQVTSLRPQGQGVRNTGWAGRSPPGKPAGPHSLGRGCPGCWLPAASVT